MSHSYREDGEGRGQKMARAALRRFKGRVEATVRVAMRRHDVDALDAPEEIVFNSLAREVER